MKTSRIAALSIVSMFSICCLCAAAQSAPPAIDSANRLFQAGKFAERKRSTRRSLAQNPKTTTRCSNWATSRYSPISWTTRRSGCRKPSRSSPTTTDAKIMLAEAFYRRDDFENAAAVLNQIGPSYAGMTTNYPTLILPKLESFKGLTPYQLHGQGDATSIALLQERAVAGGERARQ